VGIEITASLKIQQNQPQPDNREDDRNPTPRLSGGRPLALGLAIIPQSRDAKNDRQHNKKQTNDNPDAHGQRIGGPGFPSN